MSNGMPLRWWIVGPVYGGPAWTAKDSWITNIAALGALLGTVISGSGTDLKAVAIPAIRLLDLRFCFLLSVRSAAAPVIYGATGKLNRRELQIPPAGSGDSSWLERHPRWPYLAKWQR